MTSDTVHLARVHPAARPDRTEAAEYYFRYIDLVPEGDILELLQAQLADTPALLGRIGEQASLYRYAPGKWSVREVVAHVNDTERLFAFRAFWFARGFDSPLPSFDQTVAASHAAADDRAWQSHLDEFRAVRRATLDLYRHLPAAAWSRRGIASGLPFTVRAFAYLAAGHVMHHLAVLQREYAAAWR
jgi:hypothetical protein